MADGQVPAYRNVLAARGVAEETLDAIEVAAQEEVDRATSEAKAGPEPRLELALTNLWADGGHAWRN